MYSFAFTSSARSMATSLARVPGDLPCPANASAPSVHATAATGTSVASSTSLPTVLTIIVWPETSAPGAWPV